MRCCASSKCHLLVKTDRFQSIQARLPPLIREWVEGGRGQAEFLDAVLVGSGHGFPIGLLFATGVVDLPEPRTCTGALSHS